MATRAQDAWNKIVALALCDEMHRTKSTIDNVHIQKLCFLSELQGRQKNLKTAYYRFFRYNNGPYSSALANDITHLSKFGFIDPENGEVLDRGRRLHNYVKPDIERSDLATGALAVVKNIVDSWQPYKGWEIVEQVYNLPVPVDGLGKTMMVRDIPTKTDIIIPERSSALDVVPFPSEIVDDIYAELAIPQSDLDLDSEEIWRSVTDAVESAFSL
jgi:hypothetical protein